MVSAPELSLRGGRRPTWRPERAARGSALGVQSRRTRPHRGKAIGENATAFPRLPRRFAPRNDTSGGYCGAPAPSSGLIPLCKALNERRYRRNRSVRFYRHLVRTGSAFPRLPRAQSALAMTNLGAIAFLTLARTSRRCSARSGMPLPYNARPEVCVFFILHFSVFSIHFLHMPLPYSALREAMGKTPLSTLNFLRPAGGYPRTGISSNPGRAPMPRRGSDCSRPDCAPRPPRASARRPAAGSARPTGHNTSRFP